MRVINNDLLAAVRLRRCEYCNKPGPNHAAHCFTKGFGGGQQMDIEENTGALCFTCHTKHHNGKEPTPETFVQIIAQREGYPSDTIKAYLWYVQGLPKEATRQTIVEFTGKLPCPVHRTDPLLTHPTTAEPRRRHNGV